MSPAQPKLQKSSCCLPKVLYLTNRFFCVCSCPLTKSFSCISSLICPPFFSPASPPHFSSAHSFFAALLPNSAAYPASHWLCSPGPAMTVPFTRVSPVSSLSLCQSPAPTTWTCAQPQYWPTEERYDHLCVSRRSAWPFSGENTENTNTTVLQRNQTFTKRNFNVVILIQQLYLICLSDYSYLVFVCVCVMAKHEVAEYLLSNIVLD